MEDGTPILVFGDFNIHLEKPCATDFHSLLASFDLKRLTTTSTHKSGNQLDLIYTQDCTADNILVQPLHISDHSFIKFTLHFATRVPPTPCNATSAGSRLSLQVTRCQLKNRRLYKAPPPPPPLISAKAHDLFRSQNKGNYFSVSLLTGNTGTRVFLYAKRHSFISWLLKPSTQETIWILMLSSAFHMFSVDANYLECGMLFNLCLKL